MKVKVEKILEAEPNSFQGLTKTTFLSEGRAIYIFTKPENDPKEGDELSGEITQDKAGKNKFTKDKPTGYDRQAYTGPRKGVPMQKNDDGMAWGNALNNAVNAFEKLPLKATTDEVMAHAMSVLALATYFFENRGDKPLMVKTPEDQIEEQLKKEQTTITEALGKDELDKVFPANEREV